MHALSLRLQVGVPHAISSLMLASLLAVSHTSAYCADIRHFHHVLVHLAIISGIIWKVLIALKLLILCAVLRRWRSLRPMIVNFLKTVFILAELIFLWVSHVLQISCFDWLGGIWLADHKVLSLRCL